MLCVTKGLEPVPKILMTDIDQYANLRGRERGITTFFFKRIIPEITFAELRSVVCGLERNLSEHF